MKKNKKNDKKKDDNFLLYVPEIKHKTWEVKSDSVYLIFYHNKFIEKTIRWLFKKQKTSDLKLDPRGSTVWLNIDGKKTVYDLAKILSDKFGEEINDSQQRTILYVRYLMRRGWIVLNRGDQDFESERDD